jgi:hypothetical protein
LDQSGLLDPWLRLHPWHHQHLRHLSDLSRQWDPWRLSGLLDPWLRLRPSHHQHLLRLSGQSDPSHLSHQ